MITDTLQVFCILVYTLLDPGATHSFMTPYISVDFGVSLKILAEPFLVSTQVNSSIISIRGYRSSSIIVSQRVSSVYLEDLYMTYFYIILCIDWLHSSHALVDWRIRVV